MTRCAGWNVFCKNAHASSVPDLHDQAAPTASDVWAVSCNAQVIYTCKQLDYGFRVWQDDRDAMVGFYGRLAFQRDAEDRTKGFKCALPVLAVLQRMVRTKPHETVIMVYACVQNADMKCSWQT